MQYKKCRKCKQLKTTTEFNPMNIGKYGVSSTCKECTMNKPVKEIKRTPIKQKYKKPTGEANMFLEIWNTIPRKCEVCKKDIPEMKTYCFAHRCPKGTYPEHKLNKDNISLVCSIKCHGEVDKMFTGINRQKLNKSLQSNN